MIAIAKTEFNHSKKEPLIRLKIEHTGYDVIRENVVLKEYGNLIANTDIFKFYKRNHTEKKANKSTIQKIAFEPENQTIRSLDEFLKTSIENQQKTNNPF